MSTEQQQETTYWFYQEGSRNTITHENLYEILVEKSKKAKTIEYFLDVLYPKLAPSYGHHSKDYVSRWIIHQKEYHTVTYRNNRDPLIEVDAIMAVVGRLMKYENEIMGQN